MDDPRQWLQFGGQDMERAPVGLPIGQAVGTSAAYHGAEGLEDAARLANQVQAGEVSPMSDESIQRALNAAMVAQMGGFAGAPARAGETVLGSGPVLKIMDPEERALNLAKAMSRSTIKNTETNQPIRLYHATRQPNLETLKAGGHDPELSGPATWLSPYAEKQPAFHNTGGGSNYREGANVMPVYADIQTPLVLDTPEMIDWAQTAFAGGSREFPQYLHPDWRKALIEEGYDGIVYGGPKSKEYALHDLQIGQQPHRDEEILSFFPERQLKSATGNSGEFNMEIPRLSEAHGGEVDAALHAVRHHLAGGGFLSDLFSGPDYLSTGKEATFANMPTQDETAADFFKADKALRLAREAQAAGDVTGSIPVRAPLTAPRPAAVEERELPPTPVRIPLSEPDRAMAMPTLPGAAPLSNFPTIPGAIPPMSSDFQRTAPPASQTASFATQPIAYSPEPEKSPARAAIEEATGKLTARAPQGPDLTERDRDLIIRTIAAETSGKTPEESQAIAHVILNRIQSGKYGETPEDVLLAPSQFEPWSNRFGANYPMRFTPESRRYGMGQTALEAALANEDITGGATNFWAPKAQAALGRNVPPWAPKMPDYTDIGMTRFHRPNRAEGGSVVDRALMLVSRQA